MKKRKSTFLVLSLIGIVLLIWINEYSSYSRRIGDTRFYLVETMAISKDGSPLAGLYFKPTATSGYSGEITPGFPKFILWNDKYLISKNFDGSNPNIIKYIIINMDSIKPSNGEIGDIHIFTQKEDYFNYLRQINLSESNMDKTDNHLSWWKLIKDFLAK